MAAIPPRARIAHLLRRAGFGASEAELNEYAALGFEASVERLLYNTALRSLEQQERHIDELRARTGTLLAASALTATFFGGAAAGIGGPPLLVAPALAALVLSLGLCLSILAPHPIAFVPDIPGIDERLAPLRDDMRAVHSHMAYLLDRIRARNEWHVDRLSRRFRAASAFLGGEVVIWVLALAVS